MIYDIDNYVNNIAEMSCENLIVKYVGVAQNVRPAGPKKPVEAAKAPAGSAKTKHAVRRQQPGPAAPDALAEPVETDENNIVLKLDLANQDLLTGFILSEVLGKPKCFSMRRRPAGR